LANRRWLEPSTAQGRQEYRSLRKELRDAGSKKRRQELIAKLDSLYGRGDSEPGTPIPLPPAKPGNKDLQDLVDRVKSRPSEMLLSATDIQTVSDMELPAASSEWYAVIQSQWPETGFERIMQRGWLLNWRIATLKGTVSEPFADYWKRCQERFDAESAFNERYKAANPTEQAALLAEKFGLRNEPFKAVPEAAKTTKPDAEPFEASGPATVRARPEPNKATVVSAEATEPESVLDPVVRASMDLAARAALVLQTDSWLSRLAEHSPDMRTKILASLSQELLRAGFVNGDFCARLYNDSRPRALSQFPPRQF